MVDIWDRMGDSVRSYLGYTVRQHDWKGGRELEGSWKGVGREEKTHLQSIKL